MKVQQWQLRKVTEPRTLADVESSRENPVLCWVNDMDIGECFCEYGHVHRRKGNGDAVQLSFKIPRDLQLYTQPSRPKTLDCVPDRRVIVATWEEEKAKPDTRYLFRDHEIWFDLKGVDNYTPRMASYWRLTDCVVELVETEIGVLG